ncbi:MAG: DUF5667 domain-containing protein [Candidatus Aquicultor sp.]|nr:DUF5667 domain-containing protein [Candidatus Aquicultor sp.]
MEKANANNKKLENALDYSIRLLNSGASIEDCLKLYPNQRRELKELLEAAATLKSAYPGYPELRPSKLYAKTARAEFLSAIENGVPATPRARVREPQTTKSNLFVINSFYRKAILSSAAAAAAIVIAAGGLVYASGDSMPGSPLYGVKRATEKVQLALTLDEESKAKLHYSLAQKRIDEAKSMAESGKDSEVAGISKEAKESLEEAGKVAKVVPSVEKDKLTGEIDSIDSAARERVAQKLADARGVSEAIPETKAAGQAKNNAGDDENTASAETPMMTASVKRLVEKATAGSSSSKASASLAPFTVEGIDISDKYISPNADGVKDSITVAVSGAAADKFKVELYRGAVPVATIAEQTAGRNLEFVWDGKDIDGNIVADGEYFVKVSGSGGQAAYKKAKIIVDTVAPAIKLIEPPAGIETVVLRPRFVWEAGQDMESSDLYLNVNGSTREIAGITDGFYILDRDLKPGTWTWIVVVRDKAGNMNRSEARALTIVEIKDDNAPKE